MKLAMAQMSMAGSMDENLKRSLAFCDAAAGSDLLFFPEVQLTPFFPQYAGRNVDAYVVPVGSPTVQAMQNQIFVAMCNRVGREDGMDFAGESLIVHPSGDVIYKADDREQLIVQELDLAEARLWREQKRPYLRQRRPECYL